MFCPPLSRVVLAAGFWVLGTLWSLVVFHCLAWVSDSDSDSIGSYDIVFLVDSDEDWAAYS